MLQKILKKAGPALRYSEHLDGYRGEAMFRHACDMGLEGIVSKKLASPYKSGSCRSWLKIKNPAYERPARGSRSSRSWGSISRNARATLFGV